MAVHNKNSNILQLPFDPLLNGLIPVSSASSYNSLCSPIQSSKYPARDAVFQGAITCSQLSVPPSSSSIPLLSRRIQHEPYRPSVVIRSSADSSLLSSQVIILFTRERHAIHVLPCREASSLPQRSTSRTPFLAGGHRRPIGVYALERVISTHFPSHLCRSLDSRSPNLVCH